MSRHSYVCASGGECGLCDWEIEQEEARRDDDPMTDADWDAWETGPGWNNIEGRVR